MPEVIKATPQTLGEQFVSLLQEAAIDRAPQAVLDATDLHNSEQTFHSQNIADYDNLIERAIAGRPEVPGRRLQQFVLEHASDYVVRVKSIAGADAPIRIKNTYSEITKNNDGTVANLVKERQLMSALDITGKLRREYTDPYSLRLQPVRWGRLFLYPIFNDTKKPELARASYYQVEAINPDTLEPQISVTFLPRHTKFFGRLLRGSGQIDRNFIEF
jgi:hypothetical protein